MIGIIDYGVGNLFSLSSSIMATSKDEPLVSSNRKLLESCNALILPGVGAFSSAMQKLKDAKLDDFVKSEAKSGKPILGICLGMQLLFERSFEFGQHNGLGLINGEILPLSDALKEKGLNYKVPQIGWNSLIINHDHFIFRKIKSGDYVYYVHSYYAPTSESTFGESDYGVAVTGVAVEGNVVGCQFHPEKSGKVGLNILRAWCEEVDK